jgi:hypothetical protein
MLTQWLILISPRIIALQRQAYALQLAKDNCSALLCYLQKSFFSLIHTYMHPIPPTLSIILYLWCLHCISLSLSLSLSLHEQEALPLGTEKTEGHGKAMS